MNPEIAIDIRHNLIERPDSEATQHKDKLRKILTKGKLSDREAALRKAHRVLKFTIV